MVFGLVGIGAVSVTAEQHQDVELTNEQQNEMAKLQQQALEQQVKIVEKYVEYGVYSEEKGGKIISHLEEHYEKLKENDFVPQWDRKHGKKPHDKN